MAMFILIPSKSGYNQKERCNLKNENYLSKQYICHYSGTVISDHAHFYKIVASYRNAECILMSSRNINANSF